MRGLNRLVPGFARDLLRPKIQAWRWRRGQRSYAQEGEDLILQQYLFDRLDSPGYYVDIGAHHPHSHSNTFLFYRRGWRGLNIEPNPEVIALFRRTRPRDVTLNLGAAAAPGTLVYHMFEESLLNSFDAVRAEAMIARGGVHLKRRLEVAVRPLAAILSEHLTAGQAIDFMSVDAEGMDFDVIRSNDWNRFRPDILLVEMLDCDVRAAADHPIALYLAERGYRLLAKAVRTAFFRRD